MTDELPAKQSELIAALRGAVGVVQMVLFKELRDSFSAKYQEMEPSFRLLLAGSVTNVIFGADNPEAKFVQFRHTNRGLIEQELLSIQEELPELCASLTDALRIQTLCDHQEGNDTSEILIQAKELGILDEEREIPMPSSFMSHVRELGSQYNLVIPPMPIIRNDTGTIH